MAAIYDDQQEKDELEALNRIGNGPTGKPDRNSRAGRYNDLPSSLIGSSQPDADEDSEGKTDQGEAADNISNSGHGQAADILGRGFNNEDIAPRGKRGRLSRGVVKDAKKASSLKKWLGGGAGVGAAVFIIAVIIFLISSLTIPNFAQNITAYQFARSTWESAKNSERITAEKLAVDAADSATQASMRSKFGAAYDKFAGRYQPSKIISNLKDSKALTLNYDSKNVLRSVIVDGKAIDLKPTGFLGKFVPGLQFAKDLSFSRDFAPALGTALKTNDVGFIIRGTVAQSVRRELGIGLVAWTVGKYTGKNAEQARVVQQQEAFKKINDTGGIADSAKVSSSSAARAQDIANAETAQVSDDATMLAAVREGSGVPAAVSTAVDAAITSEATNGAMNAVKSFATWTNPVYGVAVPICLVYEGSLANSSATIDAQNAELQRSYYLVASAGSQQLSGNTNGEAVGAMNWKLNNNGGTTAASIPELRASGQAVDTSKSMSSEASPIGQFSIADALFPKALAGLVNNAATICPSMTNVWVGVGLGLVNIGIDITAEVLSLGTATAPIVGEEVAVDAAAKVVTQTVAKRISTALGERITLKSMKTFAADTIKTGAIVGGATLAAKFITTAQVGALHSGLDTGASFKNDADAGGNLAANEIERQGSYGVPLTHQQWQQNNGVAQKFALEQNKTKSMYERYFAVSNPYSMLSRVATVVNSNLNLRSLSSITKSFGKIFNPSNLFGGVFGMLTNQKALADATSTNANTNYGIVQFGWTPEEQALIDSSQSYQPIENQKILDDSGKAQAISDKYNTCFTDTMGSLLASSDPKIQRTTDGDTIPDKGLCSQANLSFGSVDGLATDSSADSPQSKDLIFRWRLAQSYSNSLDQLLNVQDVTP